MMRSRSFPAGVATRVVVATVLALLITSGLTTPSRAADAGIDASARGKYCANGKPTRVFRDPSGDSSSGIDITALGVWNKDGDECDWTTIAGHFSQARAQVFQVYYDTNRKRPGWEYDEFTYSPKDDDGRSGTFLVKANSHGGRYVDCPTFRRFGSSQIQMGLAKSCLGNPGHVRVRAQLFDITKYGKNNSWRGYVDQVPQSRNGWTPLY